MSMYVAKFMKKNHNKILTNKRSVHLQRPIVLLVVDARPKTRSTQPSIRNSEKTKYAKETKDNLNLLFSP